MALVLHVVDGARGVVAAATGQLLPQRFQGPARLFDEIRRVVDDDSTRVTVPCLQYPVVDRPRFRCVLGAQRILVTVSAVRAWNAQMDHGVIPLQHLLARRSNLRPEIVWA